MLTVLVGKNEVRFQLPASLAARHSQFFATSLALSAAHADDRNGDTIKLPDVETSIFGFFMTWLDCTDTGTRWNGSAGLTTETEIIEQAPAAFKVPVDDAAWPKQHTRYVKLVKLHRLAEALGSEACRNAVVDEVGKLAERDAAKVPGKEDVKLLWAPGALVALPGEGGRGLKGLVLDLLKARDQSANVLMDDQ